METISEKKIKHTPGPWRAVEEFEGWAVVKTDKKPSIGKQYIALEIAQGHDMGESDAKLIAAAPELLNACRMAIEQICNHEDGHKLQFQRVEDLLENAIKKATE